jgi:hypothetical protein
MVRRGHGRREEERAAEMKEKRGQAGQRLDDGDSCQHRSCADASSRQGRAESRDDTELGGLLSYGVDVIDQFRRAATYLFFAAQIPRTSPCSSPPSSISSSTSRPPKTLDLTIPEPLVATADEVIQ